MPGHYQHKIKHLECGLHFIVTSWKKDWRLGQRIWCPECGGTEGFVRWEEHVAGHIFEFVPGKAELTGINV